MQMPKFNRALTKKIVGRIAAYGAGAMTYGILRSNYNPDRIDLKVSSEVAAFALSGIAAVAAEKYVRQFIDDVCDNINEELAKQKTT